MNINMNAALKFIDLGSYEKAIDHINKAIAEETEKGNESTAIEYRCVLGELCINTGKIDEGVKEFETILEYCREKHTNQKQEEIAKRYIDMLNSEVSVSSVAPRQSAARHSEIPLVPKPMQNKSFISKQMNKKHR